MTEHSMTREQAEAAARARGAYAEWNAERDNQTLSEVMAQHMGATAVHHKDGVFTVTCKTRVPEVRR